jgi:hypothetical protein
MLVLLTVPGTLAAQGTAHPRWNVAGGGGYVFRTLNTSSFGAHLRVARVFQPSRGLYLEPGLAWHGYRRSPQYGDPCPLDGCPPPLEDAISLMGLELGGAYRKAEADNPVYPVGTVGLYRVSSQDTAGARFGASLGVAIPFRRSGLGPAMDIRYLRIFGDRRFRSIVPVALRWSF